LKQTTWKIWAFLAALLLSGGAWAGAPTDTYTSTGTITQTYTVTPTSTPTVVPFGGSISVYPSSLECYAWGQSLDIQVANTSAPIGAGGAILQFYMPDFSLPNTDNFKIKPIQSTYLVGTGYVFNGNTVTVKLANVPQGTVLDFMFGYNAIGFQVLSTASSARIQFASATQNHDLDISKVFSQVLPVATVLLKTSTATPSSTPSATPTITLTASISPTATPSPTQNLTPMTATYTGTGTTTQTRTPSTTPTSSITHTATITSSKTPAGSQTATPSSTFTVSSTPTVVPFSGDVYIGYTPPLYCFTWGQSLKIQVANTTAAIGPGGAMLQFYMPDFTAPNSSNFYINPSQTWFLEGAGYSFSGNTVTVNVSDVPQGEVLEFFYGYNSGTSNPGIQVLTSNPSTNIQVAAAVGNHDWDTRKLVPRLTPVGPIIIFSMTPTVSPTITITATITQTYTHTPTCTASPTITQTYTYTPVGPEFPDHAYTYPNPFDLRKFDKVTFRFPKDQGISVEVFNIVGEPVNLLPAGDPKINEAEGWAIWNGRDQYNNLVSGGIYYYRIRGQASSRLGRFTVIH
jgi:hypothetical protein